MPASELSRDASPSPSSVDDLRLARQQCSYFTFPRGCSYSTFQGEEDSEVGEEEYKFRPVSKRTMEEEAVRRSEERVAALERRLQVCTKLCDSCRTGPTDFVSTVDPL